MPYIGNDLQVAFPTYKIIDDISSGFNGSTTSFALQVGGAAPSPLPINSQQCLISVNGTVQEPDDTGSAGFKLSAGNIVFSSAPTNGHAFFGVILAGADYVTAGSSHPDGSVSAPSITFEDDKNTGFFRSSSGTTQYASDGTSTLTLAAGTTFNSDVTLTGAANNVVWDKSDNALEFADSAKATFGAGADLQIYHDGSNSYIDDAGTGSLIIGGTGEVLAKFTDDGSAELYHNNVKTFETSATGCAVTGDIAVSGAASCAFASISYAATVTLNLDNNNNFTIGNLTGAITMANPSAMTPGAGGVIKFVQDGTGSRAASWGSYWHFPGGDSTGGVLSTAANSVDILAYTVLSASSIACVIHKAIAD